jgi:hypothetical protein
MKNIYFKLIMILTMLVVPYSCSDSDNIVDGVMDNITSGGFLRTIKLNGTVVQTNVTTASLTYNVDATPFSLELEAQDNQSGALLQKVDVHLSFVKNNPTSAASINERFWKSYNASVLTAGPIGLPRLTFATTLGEIRTFLGITPTQYSGGDQFKVVFKYVMTDGRVFTYTNSNSNVVGGAYMRSPFIYNLNVVCPITESLAGTHSYVSTNMVRGGGNGACSGSITGTVVWGTTTTAGLYTTSDFSFGMYGACWGDPPATSASARVNWFCNKIVPVGADFYGDTYTYTMVSVVGSVMTLDWINGYGDKGRVAITRQGGVNWPAIFN